MMDVQATALQRFTLSRNVICPRLGFGVKDLAGRTTTTADSSASMFVSIFESRVSKRRYQNVCIALRGHVMRVSTCAEIILRSEQDIDVSTRL